jgi:tetratricopeptide (TPR) repeat protein
MEALLAALEKDPNIQRRKWAAAAAGIAVIGGLALGARHFLVDQRQVCTGGPEKLAGIWELSQPGDGEQLGHTRVRKAFVQSGKSYALDVFATVSHALDRYAGNWTEMYRQACEATHVRGEQSAEVMDLRMECLQERLGGFRALTDVFAEANGQVVENAVSAANALESLDRCADVPLLRAVVRPPTDSATRIQVTQLRSRLADLKAQFDAGRWKETLGKSPALVQEARSLGYQPLTTEGLALMGLMLAKANDATAAEKALTEAFWTADASRHDEVRAEVAANLVFVVGVQQARFAEARRWATATESVLNRMGGHDLLRAWLLNDLAAVLQAQGDNDSALRLNLQALSLKEKTLGNRHPDVAISEANLAIALTELKRYDEALGHVERAVAIDREGLGSGHPDLAQQLSNRGEILRLLDRYVEARAAFEQARAIWERELGPDSALLAYPLTGIGETYLAEGEANRALVPLARAFKIRQTQDPDRSRRAETKFAYARALWNSNRDRSRARALGEEARADYAEAQSRDKLVPVEEWLRRTNEDVSRRPLARR